VLEWILGRCRGEAGAKTTPIGWVPKPEDLDMNGLNLPSDRMDKLMAVSLDEWMNEVKDHRAFFEQFGPYLPDEMVEEMDALEARLEEAAGKKKKG